ncbi:MAG: hypothetical protein AAF806_18080 [Bacteroidota bacterium]
MEKQLIEICKTQIQERYFAQKTDLAQRDFLYLIELMEERSGILVSLSTLKRIWKGKYVRLPQVQTLNALVSILDYDNWNEYKLAQQKSTPELSQNLEKSRIKLPLIFTILSLTLIAFASIYFLFTQPDSASAPEFFIPDSLIFSADKTVTSGVPNTVIFSYDLSEAKADSFSIQRSWNPAHRTLIDPANSYFTEIYYYPGLHKAKLMANDSIIREEEILIRSEGWLAVLDDVKRPTPIYLPLDENRKGILSVSPETYEKINLDNMQDYYLSYYYIQPFDRIQHEHYEIKVRLRITENTDNICPFIHLRVIDETDVSFLTLVEKGCEANANLKMDSIYYSGRDHDLSELGVDLSEWQELQLVNSNGEANIYINKRKVFSSSIASHRGHITGLILTFNAHGEVDEVCLKDLEGGAKFLENFDQEK